MPVFSLEEARALQVKNISQNTFKYWTETAVYGYFGGGANPPFPTRINTVTRLDFSNEILSLPGKNLPSAVDNFMGVNSTLYGYFGGGLTTPTTFINTITRLDFSNEIISLPGKNLPSVISESSSISGSSYGYFGGGSTPTIINTVSRIDFSNETVSAPGKNLPVATALLVATSSNSYGYFGGGFPAFVCTISRLDFATESLSLPGKNLPYGRYNLAAISSASSGYFSGGQDGLSTYRSTISRLDFSTENTVSFPSQGALQDGAVGNSFYGYFSGGEVNTIRRLDYTSETISLPGKNFPSSISSQSTFSGGQSINRGSKTYGYFGGGYQAFPVGRLSTITRLDFSTENLSVPGNNISNATDRLVAMSNNSYGYLGGGVVPFFPTINYVYKLDFSNEISNRIGDLPTYVTDLAAVSSNVYGYFAGGYRNATPDPFPALYICTITRLDFSNDTINNPGKNLFNAPRQLTATSSSSYGYFGGGYFPNGVDFPIECKITRLDFSNETVTNPANNFSIARYLMTTTSNNSYGYFVGGWFPYFSTITRLDFSNETLSNPGKNFPVQMINSAATSNNFYGYFGGGVSPTTTICTITRLDFSTENLSVPGKNLPATREKLTALSNSN